MNDAQELKVTKWPFFLGDAFLLGLAYFVCWQGKAPLGRWEITAFMQKINEGERATLGLEVEKLRRAENDWLNVLVHMLDHVYALHSGAERAGQTQLIGQLGRFQNACRDAARRVGLVPFGAAHHEPFDGQRHQWADRDSPPAAALVTELVSTGY